MRLQFFAGLPVLLLVGWMGAPMEATAAPNEPQPAATTTGVDGGGQISFRTLDDDVQEVTVAQIWRVRATSTSDEPRDATVIDYGFERVYVKDPLDSAVDKIRAQRDLRKFTLPSGKPIYIAPDKIIGVNKPLPHQHHQNSKAIIIAREGEQQVQETRQSIADALK